MSGTDAANRGTAKRQLPLKYYIILFVAGLAYLWARPHLERWTGMELPGPRNEQVANNDAPNAEPALPDGDVVFRDAKNTGNSTPDLIKKTLGDDSSAPSKSGTSQTSSGTALAQKPANTKSTSQPRKKTTGGNSVATKSNRPAKNPNTSKRDQRTNPGTSGRTSPANTASSGNSRTNPSRNTSKSSAKSTASKTTPGKPPLGKLTDKGRRVYESTAGLLYTPGSAEGHRIDHLMRHAKDQPDRRGSHGVFDGGREAVFAVLDEAYMKIRSGGRGVRKSKQDNRMVYTVDLRRRIGYIGGQSGKRRNNPPVNHVRIVLEGKRVITAYPLKP